MTKVQVRYGLARPLDESLLGRIADLHGIYGMLRVAPTLEGLTVEFDASRLSERDVEGHLRRAGIPIQLSV
jgi:ribosomal 30S subunit maturation factor RimM